MERHKGPDARVAQHSKEQIENGFHLDEQEFRCLELEPSSMACMSLFARWALILLFSLVIDAKVSKKNAIALFAIEKDPAPVEKISLIGTSATDFKF